jgi:hypothetical protein
LETKLKTKATMKKILIAVAMLLSLVKLQATEPTFVVTGTSYESVKKASQKSEPTATPYTYKSGDKEYPIYLSKNGRAYVLKVSGKTGNEYKYYLGEEISRDICAKMNVEYVEKK